MSDIYENPEQPYAPASVVAPPKRTSQSLAYFVGSIAVISIGVIAAILGTIGFYVFGENAITIGWSIVPWSIIASIALIVLGAVMTAKTRRFYGLKTDWFSGMIINIVNLVAIPAIGLISFLILIFVLASATR